VCFRLSLVTLRDTPFVLWIAIGNFHSGIAYFQAQKEKEKNL
jgi:hypothetical protein